VINEGLSEIHGAFPVPPPRESRERNDNPESREEATGTWGVCKPRLPSIIVITLSRREIERSAVPAELKGNPLVR
jgi:hypothetical protein